MELEYEAEIIGPHKEKTAKFKYATLHTVYALLYRICMYMYAPPCTYTTVCIFNGTVTAKNGTCGCVPTHNVLVFDKVCLLQNVSGLLVKTVLHWKLKGFSIRQFAQC